MVNVASNGRLDPPTETSIAPGQRGVAPAATTSMSSVAMTCVDDSTRMVAFPVLIPCATNDVPVPRVDTVVAEGTDTMLLFDDSIEYWPGIPKENDTFACDPSVR